jgi:serine O-acetyltransferase
LLGAYRSVDKHKGFVHVRAADAVSCSGFRDPAQDEVKNAEARVLRSRAADRNAGAQTMSLIDDIKCVRARDPAAGSWAEVLLCYPGLHAIIAHRVNHWLWMRGFRLIARIGSQVVRWLTGVEIHPGAVIGQRCFIDHGAGVVIGETAQVGNDVTLYHGVTLGTAVVCHGKRHPSLGDRVFVGAGAKILGAITVHADAIIGGNAVVLQDVPAGATVVGMPARVVRIRSGRTEYESKDLNMHRDNSKENHEVLSELADHRESAL